MECCWAELLKKVHESTNLDDIIAAHEAFLDYILSSCLIDNQSKVRHLLNLSFIFFVREWILQWKLFLSVSNRNIIVFSCLPIKKNLEKSFEGVRLQAINGFCIWLSRERRPPNSHMHWGQGFESWYRTFESCGFSPAFPVSFHRESWQGGLG